MFPGEASAGAGLMMKMQGMAFAVLQPVETENEGTVLAAVPCQSHYRTFVQLSQEGKCGNRDQVIREQATRGQATKEQATREQVTGEQVMGDGLEKENAARYGARGRIILLR